MPAKKAGQRMSNCVKRHDPDQELRRHSERKAWKTSLAILVWWTLWPRSVHLTEAYATGNTGVVGLALGFFEGLIAVALVIMVGDSGCTTRTPEEVVIGSVPTRSKRRVTDYIALLIRSVPSRGSVGSAIVLSYSGEANSK